MTVYRQKKYLYRSLAQGLSQIETYVHLTEYTDKDYIVVGSILFYSLLISTARKSLRGYSRFSRLNKAYTTHRRIINSKNIVL